MSKRRSAIFCATSVYGGKPNGRVRVKYVSVFKFSILTDTRLALGDYINFFDFSRKPRDFYFRS